LEISSQARKNSLVCYNISFHICLRKVQINRVEIRMAIIPGQTALHRAGMGLSGLCLIHCLMMPFMLAALPLSFVASLPFGWIEPEWFHAALIGPVVLVSGTALLRGGGKWLVVLVAAMAALVAALLVPSEVLETALTTAGASALLTAHWFGLRRNSVDGLKCRNNIPSHNA